MKKRSFKQAALLTGGLASFVFSLVYFIRSFEVYRDEYGTDISSNGDYLVAMLVSLCVIAYAVYLLIVKKDSERRIYAFSGICATALTCFYPLGVFFKAMNKGNEFASYQPYLYLGIVSLFLLIYFIFVGFEGEKETK